ncbi:MAG: hypothetical protein J6126_04310 [Clostridia bacterium]|nr:hypothetical protein [Clostridia bacterium]
MQNRKENEQTLNNLYQNAHVAMQSISDLLPEADDEMIKGELEDQFNGYKKAINDISEYMKSNDITPKDINPIKKLMLKTSIKMNAAKNFNRSHIAEMMIKGTVMGLTDIYRDLGEKEDVTDPKVEELARMLADLEETYEKRLKTYL